MCVDVRQAGPTGPGVSFEHSVFVSELVGNSSASAWETSVFGELFCGVSRSLFLMCADKDEDAALVLLSTDWVWSHSCAAGLIGTWRVDLQRQRELVGLACHPDHDPHLFSVLSEVSIECSFPWGR